MTGYVDDQGHAIPMPSIDFGGNAKAAERYKREWIDAHERMGHVIIP